MGTLSHDTKNAIFCIRQTAALLSELQSLRQEELTELTSELNAAVDHLERLLVEQLPTSLE